MNTQIPTINLFIDKVITELKRAERYRIFLSITIIDLGFVEKMVIDYDNSLIDEMFQHVKNEIRAIDNVSIIEPYKIGLLFPETTRQGAEIVSKRIVELIRNKLLILNDNKYNQVIPLEMVSYPDAAGAKSIANFLKEFPKPAMN